METQKMSVMERLSAPTPKFFKTIRNLGIVLGAIGGTLITVPGCPACMDIGYRQSSGRCGFSRRRGEPNGGEGRPMR